MSESEIRKAELDVERSTERLENALDQLIDKIETGNERFEAFRNQITEIRDQLDAASRDPQATLEQWVGPMLESAGKYLVDRRVDIENYLSEKAQKIETNVKATLDCAFHDTELLVDNLVSDLGRQAGRAVDQIESRRFESWATVFFMGCLAGAIFHQRRARQPGAPSVPGELPWPKPRSSASLRKAA